jgi:pimeloyl-ACP methyl ester carboxylesterase
MTGFILFFLMWAPLGVGIPNQPAGVTLQGTSFDVRDVTFDSSGVSLSGRLFAPHNDSHGAKLNYPVAIFVTGSGEDDVNEGGYPRALARVFASSGIGLFVYNKRGVGKSQGSYSNSDFAERAQDTLAAVRTVRSLSGVDSRHVGLWGISQGGWVIGMAAGQSSDVSFVILVSPAGVNPKRQMDFYLQNEWRRVGMNEEEIRKAGALHDILFEYYAHGKNYQRAQAAVDEAKKAGWLDKYRQANFRQEVPQTGRLISPAELAALNQEDPTELDFYHALSIVADYHPNYLRLSMPTLVIYGGRDIYVPVAESMAAFKKAFAENHNQRAEFKVFEEGDHGIQAPGSAGFVPGYIEFMRDWIWKTIQKAQGSR